ncbi:MAG: hypothetical protein DCF16_10950 [Alphaproteobacteria bacterium]|nr:MAG: hypothetical protein DCF16_10950 [Alphaproteobacteria bacterium]
MKASAYGYVALAVGLLIGAERERRKGEDKGRGAAGIRTFALAAVLGALAHVLGDAIFAAAMLGAAALAAVSYARSQSDDPGLTTEFALLVTVLLGGLAPEQPSLAGALGVVVAALLAIRTPLHHFIREALSRDELRDALVLAIATFVIWPLLPAAAVGPFGALNLHAIWLVVILAMSIGAMGHVAVRIAGPRLGIPVAGFFSGFISSTATIAALAARAAHEPGQLNAAVAGAVLSSIATLIQMGVLLLVIDVTVLRALAAPLLCAGAAAAIYAAYFVVIALKTSGTPAEESGRAFSIVSALTFGALVCVVLVVTAVLDHWFGTRGALASTAIAGFVDVHAASVSAAALASSGALTVRDAVLPIVIALSTNTVSKILMSFSAGRGAFSTRVTAGLVTIAAAAWIGLGLAEM